MNVSIGKKILNVLDNKNEDGRNYIGASSIGAPCERKVWYQYKGQTIQAQNTLKLSFEIGSRLEAMILDFLEKTDVEVIRPSPDNELLFCSDKDIITFCGHMDAILKMPHSGEKAILDIKTAKATSFIRFKTLGIRDWNIQYYAQLQSYMGMTGINHAVLLAINKDNSDLHEEWIEFDSIYYEELKMKAKRIMDAEVEPERINKNKLFYQCRMCGYKEKCHE